MVDLGSNHCLIVAHEGGRPRVALFSLRPEYRFCFLKWKNSGFIHISYKYTHSYPHLGGGVSFLVGQMPKLSDLFWGVIKLL